jgi:type IV pilus assembly protein PilA
MRRTRPLLLLPGLIAALALTACGENTQVATVSAPAATPTPPPVAAAADAANPQVVAADQEAKAYVRTAQTAIETFYSDHRTYAGASRAKLYGIEPALTGGPGARIEVSRPSATGYTVAITSRSGAIFRIDNKGGIVTRTCSPAGAGACPAGGAW